MLKSRRTWWKLTRKLCAQIEIIIFYKQGSCDVLQTIPLSKYNFIFLYVYMNVWKIVYIYIYIIIYIYIYLKKSINVYAYNIVEIYWNPLYYKSICMKFCRNLVDLVLTMFMLLKISCFVKLCNLFVIFFHAFAMCFSYCFIIMYILICMSITSVYIWLVELGRRCSPPPSRDNATTI